MAVYYKPQSPIQSGEDFIYPITTADQVKVDKDTRLNAVGVYLKNIDNSTDTTVYGNNATTLGGVAAEDYALKTDTAPDSSKLGGVAASDYALKTDTAPDSSKLGGKAPEYYLQPRNLLDNSDFRNPVNQRGRTSYSGIWVYSIDRWCTWLDASNPATVSVVSGGITPFPGMVIQRIESKYIDSSKTYTLAAMTGYGLLVLSGKVTSATQSSTNNNNGIYFDFNTDSDTYQFTLAGLTSASKFIWAALYEGSYTADTLPPYVPKGYTAELAECRRYAKRIGGALAGIAHGYESGKAYATIFTSGPKMRIAPSVDDYSKIQIINGEYYSDQFTSITGIATIATREDSITFWIESSEISAGKDYYISCEKGVLFSSDL